LYEEIGEMRANESNHREIREIREEGIKSQEVREDKSHHRKTGKIRKEEARRRAGEACACERCGVTGPTRAQQREWLSSVG
jgi:hypothetical protein